jgi:tetratricopeptide (TPR) repeat protein
MPEKPDYETSELLLYKNMILEESGAIKAALEHLDKVEKLLLDKLYVREKRAEFLLKLNRFEEAEKQYRELLTVNSENKNYHIGLQRALQLAFEGRHYLLDTQH